MLALSTVSAFAEPVLRGELKVQEDALFARTDDQLERAAGRSVAETSASFRLKTEGQRGAWSYDLHYLLEGAYSTKYSELQSIAPSGDSQNFLDLEDQLTSGSDGSVRHRIDRGWVGYSAPSTVIKIGRQALTWGHGQVFRPMDLFNPFAPAATDMSYKPGTDMLYGQHLLSGGADVQFLAVPRKDAGGAFESSQSSYAVKGFWRTGSAETEVMAARDYGEGTVAVGATGPVGAALWKTDVVVTFNNDGGTTLSSVASFQGSWSWKQRPVAGFVEYYHNGFGVSDRRPATELPADLVQRIARGQIFVTGRDYVAVGGTVQWTPLILLAPTLITNLNDRSALGIVSVDYNVADKTSLIGGMQLPFGPRRTEFGGRELSAGGNEYDRPPARLFVRLELYF
jgi:hypothetical protein